MVPNYYQLHGAPKPDPTLDCCNTSWQTEQYIHRHFIICHWPCWFYCEMNCGIFFLCNNLSENDSLIIHMQTTRFFQSPANDRLMLFPCLNDFPYKQWRNMVISSKYHTQISYWYRMCNVCSQCVLCNDSVILCIMLVWTLFQNLHTIPDSKVNGANMGPIWGRQDPGGPHVGPVNLGIWDGFSLVLSDFLF